MKNASQCKQTISVEDDVSSIQKCDKNTTTICFCIGVVGSSMNSQLILIKFKCIHFKMSLTNPFETDLFGEHNEWARQTQR